VEVRVLSGASRKPARSAGTRAGELVDAQLREFADAIARDVRIVREEVVLDDLLADLRRSAHQSSG
jgi:hypothetical protein